MKFAAIDIGSNAARLLISNVIEAKGKVAFKKESLLRVPLRLGDDAFALGRITETKAEDLIETMKAFRSLLRVQKPLDWMACGTAALRGAENGPALVEQIAQQAGLQVEIIDGKREAEIICTSPLEEKLDPARSYLYIDVGGGSTEVTLMRQQKRVNANSFLIGTLRALHGQAITGEAERFRQWLQTYALPYQPLSAIGTGGNINTLHKLTGMKSSKPLTIDKIDEMLGMLRTYSVDERVEVLGLRPDRADVIVHATEIYRTAMIAAGTQEMFVPQIGLVDGIISLLYEKHRQKAI